MFEALKTWFQDPLVSKIAISAAGVIIIFFLARLSQRLASSRISDPETRYRVRKGLNLLGYLIAIIFVGRVSLFCESCSR